MNSRYLFTFTISLAGVLMSACAHQPKTTSSQETKQDQPIIATSSTAQIESRHAPSLLEFAHNFAELSLEAQKKELADTLQKIGSTNHDQHQKTRAAMIYALPTSKLRDPTKAQPLLDELTREKRLSKEESAIVSILRENAADITKLNQRIREEQRRAEENQQKASGLQQKLDELKKIERTMMQKSLKDPNRSSSK